MKESLSDLQKRVDDVLQGYEKPYWEPLSLLAHLTEEVGEVARILNHQYGDKPKKTTDKEDDLEDELQDILWNLICIANREGINLEKAIERSFEKLQGRDKDRFKKKN